MQGQRGEEREIENCRSSARYRAAIIFSNSISISAAADALGAKFAYRPAISHQSVDIEEERRKSSLSSIGAILCVVVVVHGQHSLLVFACISSIATTTSSNTDLCAFSSQWPLPSAIEISIAAAAIAVGSGRIERC